MSLLSSNVDIAALTDLVGETVNGALDKSDSSPGRQRLIQALEGAGAGLEEVATQLATQLHAQFDENARSKAIKSILEVHGLIGANKDRNSTGDINIVVHTQEANLQSNMFSPQRKGLD